MTLGKDGSLARCAGVEIERPRSPCRASTARARATRSGAGLPPRAFGPLKVELEDALSFANAVAGLNCRWLGARGGIPTAGEGGAVVLR